MDVQRTVVIDDKQNYQTNLLRHRGAVFQGLDYSVNRGWSFLPWTSEHTRKL